ncbi:hypothetical protein TWF730_006792 [Orbilia blumenaviensis]|uniref:Haloacid dehalogenase-like hydrolase domain-containing protein 3 n=1 Tax=Orbilia blumenaviensis TaxID=1796055 RepID=A0AAV9VFA7_9PEZI
MSLPRTLLGPTLSLTAGRRSVISFYTSISHTCCRRRIHSSRTLLSSDNNNNNNNNKNDKSPGNFSPYSYEQLRDIIIKSSIDSIHNTSPIANNNSNNNNNSPNSNDEETDLTHPKAEEPTNLLITLDALGTLYGIKNENVGLEYANVAKSCGVTGLLAQDVTKSFKKAYKELTASHPNYGFGTGMTPEEWWEQIAIKTFTPLIPFPISFPENLANALWKHFSSKDAYTLYLGTQPFLWNIKDLKSLAQRTRTGTADWKFRTVTIGVISNSDDRVVNILNSFNITTLHRCVNLDGEVSYIALLATKERNAVLAKKAKAVGAVAKKALRKIANARKELVSDEQIVDFAVTSCRMGIAKPEREIFEAAKKAAEKLVAHRHGEREAARGWEWYHVGDNAKEDVVGAFEAGAVGVLFDRLKSMGETEVMVKASEKGMGYKTMVVGDLREVSEFAEGMGFLYDPVEAKMPIPKQSEDGREPSIRVVK